MTIKNSSPKKITIFLEDLAEGGAQRVLTNLANELVTRNYQVEFALYEKEGVYIKQLSNDVRVVFLEAKSKFNYLSRFVKYLRNHQPDIVISSLELINFIAIIGKFLSASKSKFVIRIANTVSIQKRPAIKKVIEKIAVTILYRYADEIIAVSNGVADDLSIYARIDRRQITTIYSPVIFPNLLKKSSEVTSHAWFPVKSEPVILGIGRLSPQKNFANLIKAFAIIKERTQAQLIILGSGEQRRELETLIRNLNLEEVVDLPGFVENPYAFLNSASVFVLCSDWEGLPVALIEALACGIKIVSTDCPSGPREILKDGEYGTLVPPGNPVLLAQAISGALEDKNTKPVPDKWLEQFTASYSTTKIIALLFENI